MLVFSPFLFKYHYSMANKIYTTITSALKATTADIRKLNVKSINAEHIILNGEDITEKFGFQSPEDFKKLVTTCGDIENKENYIIFDEAGNPVYSDFLHKITDGTDLFFKHNLQVFKGIELTNLKYASPGDGLSGIFFLHNHLKGMFESCKNLEYFSADLPSLIRGSKMFSDASLITFESTLPVLDSASSMFKNNLLRDFDIDMPKLNLSNEMFKGCLNLQSFNSFCKPSLSPSMFENCSSLTSANNISLINLTNGTNMFKGCHLDKESTLHLISTLKENMKNKYAPISTTMSPSWQLTLGIDASLSNDADILNALGITAGQTNTTLISAASVEWEITIEWN